MMKAAVFKQYGPPEVVKIEEIAEPTCGPKDLLIEVKATTISAGDRRVRAAAFPRGMGILGRMALGVTGPRQQVLGTELAGIVVKVGDDVKDFAVGDHVVGFPGSKMGAHAEKVVMRENQAVIKVDDDLDWKIAAAMTFGGNTALHFFQEAHVAAGEKVLIYGASGAVGSAAVQLAAHHFGAQVTAVSSAKNHPLMLELGATEVIDYATTDFRQNGKKYDVIMDAFGALNYADCAGSLEEKGRLLLVSTSSLSQMLGANMQPNRGTHRIIAVVVPEKAETMRILAQLVREGKFKPVIEEHVFSFERIVEAHALVEGGHKRGSVVVMIN